MRIYFQLIFSATSCLLYSNIQVANLEPFNEVDSAGCNSRSSKTDCNKQSEISSISTLPQSLYNYSEADKTANFLDQMER